MKIKIKISFIFLLIVLYYVNLIGRMHGIFVHYVISGILNFILTFLLLKINPFEKTGLFLIILPLFLLTPTIFIGFLDHTPKPGFIGHVMYIISTAFGFFLSIKYNIKLIILYVIIYSLLIYNFDNINNYYYYKMTKNEKESIEFNFYDIKLTDRNGKK